MEQTKKDSLTVKTSNNRDEMGRIAAKDGAERINALLAEQPEVNIIFASAPSQDDMLRYLANEPVDWTRINAFHMDEYVGISPDAPQCFGYYLKVRLFDLKPLKRVFYLGDFTSATPNPAECERYAALLKQYPPDIVFMGIGENGHIAFNDPHVADFNDPLMVKIVDLDSACRRQQVNDGCFATLDDVPTHAYTLTVPTLTGAKYHFCTVPSKTKAQAVYNTLNGAITTACPAGILRTCDNAILYLDADSASLLL